RPWCADAAAAAERGHHLHGKAAARRGLARLAAAGDRTGTTGARLRPVAGCLFRRPWRADSRADGRCRNAVGTSPAWHRARRTAVDRLRRGRAAPAQTAAAGSHRARYVGIFARLRIAARDCPAVPRYRLTIEYCGAGLVGWQRQANGLSVQQALETAIRRFCGENLTVFGAGRTDAGVHALAQVAHVDLPRAAEPEVIRGAVNHHLRPHAISVLAVEPAPPGFDARLSATG